MWRLLLMPAQLTAHGMQYHSFGQPLTTCCHALLPTFAITRHVKHRNHWTETAAPCTSAPDSAGSSLTGCRIQHPAHCPCKMVVVVTMMTIMLMLQSPDCPNSFECR